MVVDTLKTSSKGIQIKANEVWGAIRGLETLGQLIICINNTVSGKYKYFVLKHSKRIFILVYILMLNRYM